MERKEFFWKKINGKLKLNDFSQSERIAFLAAVPEGGTVRETLSRVRKQTTDQQRRAFFGMVISIVQEELTNRGYEVMGVPLTKDQVKNIVYHFCAVRDRHDKPITLSSHPESSVGNTMVLFENACTWTAENFGRYIPPPDPNWREKKDTQMSAGKEAV